MKFPLLRPALAALVLAAAPLVRAQDIPVTPELLQALLVRFPEADTNKDGILSEDEARAYYAKMRAKRTTAPKAASVAPAPTLADVSYGPAPRNVLDFWRAKSDRPAPVVIYIHGGGFIGGDKSKARDERLVQQCLEAGVSFAAINYRYLSPAAPIQDVLRDCARAVQFIRSKAGEWNVDPVRLASYGSSAGAGASLWLAFHDDLADPKNADPVLRESSRLVCAGSMSGQFTYDFPQWTEVFGAETVQRFKGIYGSPELYGLKTEADVLGAAGRKVRADCDLRGLISKDDVPVFLSSSLPGLELENTNQFLHHPKHSQLLYDRCREVGVPVVASIPALGIRPPPGGPASWRDFVFKQLGVTAAGAK
ncbi:MAG: alpha/beta hydrolase [Verrucomicrobia bacterium]|nr:alpha/beta hydrolase [Verrucomicrobiota bacterium]